MTEAETGSEWLGGQGGGEAVYGQEPGLSWRRHSFASPSDFQQSRALVSIPLFRGISCPPPLGLNEAGSPPPHLLPSAQFLYLPGSSHDFLSSAFLHAALRLISRGHASQVHLRHSYTAHSYSIRSGIPETSSCNQPGTPVPNYACQLIV